MNPSLHVLLVSSSSGSNGGGELYLVGLAEGLSRQGHSVDVLVSTLPRMDRLAQLLAPWARVHRHPYRGTYDTPLRSLAPLFAPAQVRSFARLFRELNPHLIHINKQNVEDGLDLLLAARRSCLPYLATIHITRSMAALGARAGLLRDAVSRRILRRANCPYIAIAEACQADLAAQLGPPHAASIHRVWNGVRQPAPGDRHAIRASWGLEPHHLLLGCVARLEPQKNPLFLLQLLAGLPPHVRLVWIGDGSLRTHFAAETHRLALADRVRLTGWCDDAPQRLAALDLFLLPSQYEGLPLAILEAMAAGLPCVVSDVDGVREAVLDGTTGRLCRFNNQPDWLAALQPLIADADARARLGAAARQRYHQHFSLDAMARETVNVYRAVLGSAPPPARSAATPDLVSAADLHACPR